MAPGSDILLQVEHLTHLRSLKRRGVLLAMLEELAGEIQVVLLTHDRRVLNQVREAHVLGVGTSHKNRDLTKVQVRP